MAEMKTVVVAGLLSIFCAACERSTPPGEIAVAAGTRTSSAAPIKLSEGDWPWWRGPGADGRSDEQNLPTRWSPTENVLWKLAVTGMGHSSPSICGTRVFLTTADEQAQTQEILAIDSDSGDMLWRTVAHEGGLMKKHQKNSHASATAACDGERVYAAFINDGGLHVTATDLDGGIVWQTKAGDFKSEHGYGSAPALHGSLVIVNGDSLDGSFVAALDRATGDVVWRTPREATGQHGSYATPVVAKLAGRPQLLLTGTSRVTSYDPDTGKLIWSCAGPAEVTAGTVAFSEDLVFASGGFPEKEVLAIRADGSGDVTGSHVAWRAQRGVTYVPSPLYHEGRLYVISDDGIAVCFDARTGKQLWQERLGGNFTASPVLTEGRLYATNEAGKTFVFKAADRFELVAENDLQERTLASPAIARGRIYLRTDQHLYCIAEPAAE
jgi:hypothetical protein